ncbi:ABC transporter ATP-binding protein [Candidatus Kryptobacter tengchongensis]|uniref:ABC-2 type transport system ATP-binding protein n=1 Tax=Kryptobacter tengchongensis TaxID=1643429 RepID=A0A656DAV9_KRYT1|nr:ATP-binding cassette domain-containing protein [Candidatus Kryptobacter tengchongensis]CUT03775.1 ABC-2 type transport system ATP-binding protein [Candidatus Kryptobacter tengchongensis]
MLKVENLRKTFSDVVAVDGVSFEVNRGEIFGLLGPNGAGKTTTIRMILDIIKPDYGVIKFDGKEINDEIKSKIGYLPEERGLYRKTKVFETILYFARLKGIEKKTALERARYWLKRFGLIDRVNSKIEELSKGNQQKIQIIISILHDPELVILDEPFAGLDPVNQELLKEVLLELRDKGKAIIFSTHQMDQVEKLCDSICLINKGKPVLSGSLTEVKSKFGKNTIHIEFEGDADVLKYLTGVKKVNIYPNYAEITLEDGVSSTDVLRELIKYMNLKKFEVKEPSLHSIFIDVVSRGVVQG